MYLRATTRKNKNGETVRYLQLAENVRDPQKGYPVARVLYNFGRADQVDEAALRRLAKSVIRFLSPEDAIQAQVDLDPASGQLRFVESLPYGSAYVLASLWKEFGLGAAVSGVVADSRLRLPVEQAILAMVAGRALSPRSKRATARWLDGHVAIPDVDRIPLHQLYRAMDVLVDAEAELKRRVFERVAHLLNLEVDLLFFDTTSTYFEIESEDGFRRRGHSKDSRPDAAQVVIGLAVTREGIPIRVWTWPGNTADVTRIETVRNDLRGWRLGRVIQVVDRGFVSEENLHEMTRGGDHYIAGVKMRQGSPEVEAALSRAGRFKTIRDNIEVKEIWVGAGEKRTRYVLARNPKEAERDRLTRESIVRHVTEAMTAIRVLEKGHVKAACELAAHEVYGRYVKLNEKTGQLSLNRERIRQEERLDGKYLITTSDDTLSAEDVVLGYRQLLEVEEAWRTLKTTLELRPIYHRLEKRIRAHMVLCWLALMLVRIAEYRTGETWREIREELDRMHLGRFEGEAGTVWRRTETRPEQAALLKALKVAEPPVVLRADPRQSKGSTAV
jgi:transposase